MITKKWIIYKFCSIGLILSIILISCNSSIPSLEIISQYPYGGNELHWVNNNLIVVGGMLSVYKFDDQFETVSLEAREEYEGFPGRGNISKDFLYSTNYDSGLILFDLSSPETPQNVEHNLPDQHLNEIVLYDSYAFVSSTHDSTFKGFKVLDLTDFPMIAEVNQVPSGTKFGEMPMGIYNNFLIVPHELDRIGSRTRYEIHIYDIQDPENPKLISKYTEGEEAFLHHITDLLIDDHYVYILSSGPGLVILDIEDIHNPIKVSQVEIVGHHQSITKSGDTIFLGSLRQLISIDVKSPSTPHIKTINKMESLGDVLAVENVIFVLDNGKLKIFKNET